MSKTTNYHVGYGRPPVQHQFKPGQSGNRSGRPKGTRNFRSDLRDELTELVTVKDGDRLVEVTRQRAVLKVLVNAALEGDRHAAITVLSLCCRAFGSETEPNPNEMELDAADQAIAEASEQRQRKRADAIANSNKM